MATNPRLIDLTDQRFGLWSVVRKNGNTARGAALWLCRCDCGSEGTVTGTDLRNGKSTGCGCIGAARLGALRLSHGGTGTRLYRIWTNMRARCERLGHPQAPEYGGRGIGVCTDWQSFAAFREWALANGYRDDLSIERKDVNGNYEPSNCTWANSATQSANRRFVAKADDGELWLHKALANGITKDAFYVRKRNGWPMEEAVSWPMGKKRRDGNLSRAVLLTLNGEELPVAHAAKRIGRSPAAIYQRAKRNGISMQEALDQLSR